MAMNYTTFPIQLAQLLRMMRKREVLAEHIRLADNANYDRRLLVAANGFSTSDTGEAKVLSSQLARLDNASLTALRNEWRALRSLIESKNDFFGLLADDLGASEQDRNAGAIQYVHDVSEAGAVTIRERRGLLGLLYKDMQTNSQHILPNGVTLGPLTAVSGNRGALTSTSHTALSHALTGTVVFEVVDEDVTLPQIRVTHEFTNPTPDGITFVTAANFLTPEQSFTDGPTGHTIVLTRSGLAAPTETDPTGFVASTTIATPASGDCDNGVFHLKISRVATAPIWVIEVYSDSSRTTKVGVPNAECDGTSGTQILTIVCNNGTTITTTFNKTTAAANIAAGASDSSVSWDIKTPRLGDKWYRSCTNDEAGNYATKMAKAWRFTLPTNAVPSFTDSNASSISMS